MLACPFVISPIFLGSLSVTLITRDSPVTTKGSLGKWPLELWGQRTWQSRPLLIHHRQEHTADLNQVLGRLVSLQSTEEELTGELEDQVKLTKRS